MLIRPMAYNSWARSAVGLQIIRSPVLPGRARVRLAQTRSGNPPIVGESASSWEFTNSRGSPPGGPGHRAESSVVRCGSRHPRQANRCTPLQEIDFWGRRGGSCLGGPKELQVLAISPRVCALLRVHCLK